MARQGGARKRNAKARRPDRPGGTRVDAAESASSVPSDVPVSPPRSASGAAGDAARSGSTFEGSRGGDDGRVFQGRKSSVNGSSPTPSSTGRIAQSGNDVGPARAAVDPLPDRPTKQGNEPGRDSSN